MHKLTNRSCTPWRICHEIFFVYTKPDKKTRFTPNLRHFRTIYRGAAPDTVGTVSTETDFFDQDEFFYHFIQNMKWVSSFILNSKFNSEAYFLHSSPFASIWCKGRKTMTFDCHILHEHFSCGCCNTMTSNTNLICKSNVLFMYASFADVCHYQEKLYDKDKIF